MSKQRHYVTYDDDLAAGNGNRWPCWCAAGVDHGESDESFQASAAAMRKGSR
jgi:hypothetical protein